MSLELLLLLLLPLAGAILLFLAKTPAARMIALGCAFAQLAITFYVLYQFDYNAAINTKLQYEINLPWSSAIRSSIHFGLDGMSLLMVLLTNTLVPLILISSQVYRKFYNHTFYALVLLMQFGLVGVFSALDGLLFYVFWEVTLIPIWLICGIWGDPEKRFRFTTKFFVYTFVGSLFMLGGLIYTYNYSASFSVVDLYNANLNVNQQTVVFWFIFFAFAVKLPIFPFHTWQPDTYTYPPTQATMLLSGIMLKMAVYGVLRYLIPVTPAAVGGISGYIVLILAIVGVLHGAMIALIQTDVKRILAYSSFSHVGLMIAGIFASAILVLRTPAYTIEGAQGALVQAFAHGFNVVGLFLAADVLIRRFGTRDIREMGGLARVMPLFAVLFMIIMLGSLGVPLTNGFIGEFSLLKSVFDYSRLLAAIAGLSIIFAAGYLLRMYGKTMFEQGNDKHLASALPLASTDVAVLATVAGVVILFGIFPQPVFDLVHSSLDFIFQSLKAHPLKSI